MNKDKLKTDTDTDAPKWYKEGTWYLRKYSQIKKRYPIRTTIFTIISMLLLLLYMLYQCDNFIFSGKYMKLITQKIKTPRTCSAGYNYISGVIGGGFYPPNIDSIKLIVKGNESNKCNYSINKSNTKGKYFNVKIAGCNINEKLYFIIKNKYSGHKLGSNYTASVCDKNIAINIYPRD